MAEEIVAESLNVFQKQPKKCGIEAVQWVNYMPVAEIRNGSPIQFAIKSPRQYIDLSRSYLYIKARVLKDGKPLEKGKDDVAPTNLWLHTLFKQVDVTLNQQLLFNSGTNYHYKSYIETVLKGNGKDAQLTSEMYYKDIGGKVDANKVADGSYSYSQRKEWIADGSFAEMQGPLHADICQLNKLIPNGVDVGIKLYRSDASFALMSAADYAGLFTIEIEEAIFKACKVTPDPEVFLAHNEILSKGVNMHLPLNKTELQTYIIPRGSNSWSQNDMFQSRIPHTVLVCLVNSDAYHGDFTKSPYNFDGHDLGAITLLKDGQAVPKNQTSVDFANKECIDAYADLMNNAPDCNIAYQHFIDGYAMYMYKLSDDHYSTECRYPTKTGNLGLHATFRKPLPHNVVAVIYAQFAGAIEVDHNRLVTIL